MVLFLSKYLNRIEITYVQKQQIKATILNLLFNINYYTNDGSCLASVGNACKPAVFKKFHGLL
ncbi:hypothetical protein D3C76_1364430 [compost metagenome]